MHRLTRCRGPFSRARGPVFPAIPCPIARRWSPQRKRLYAHHLDNPNHLIAVTARANRSEVPIVPKGPRIPRSGSRPIPHTGAGTPLTGAPSSTNGTSRLHRRNSRRWTTCSPPAVSRINWVLSSPSRSRTCRPSEAARLCLLPPTIILADSTVPVMRRMLRVKPVSAAARARVVASPGRWRPALGTVMATAWYVSAEPVSRHSTDQARLASYTAAGVRMLPASCRNSSASSTSRYTSVNARSSTPTSTGSQASSSRYLRR